MIKLTGFYDAPPILPTVKEKLTLINEQAIKTPLKVLFKKNIVL